MMEQGDYTGQILSEISAKMRDIEGKQRVSKDRLLLIGENLVEIKETTNKKILDIKKDVEIMKQEIERLSSFLETVSSEFSKFAKKEDLEILIKQAKMFQPLNLMSKKDLERLKNI
jgi:archaellum component FlaC